MVEAYARLQIYCNTCHGWHYLNDLKALEGTTDISYFCPAPPELGSQPRVNIAFESK